MYVPKSQRAAKDQGLEAPLLGGMPPAEEESIWQDGGLWTSVASLLVSLPALVGS